MHNLPREPQPYEDCQAKSIQEIWWTCVQWHLGAMSSAGVGPLCFLRTNITAPVYQEILEHFMLPSADQIFKDADFIFQQDLAPAHTAKSTKSWLKDHDIGVCLTGQQTHQTWTP